MLSLTLFQHVFATVPYSVLAYTWASWTTLSTSTRACHTSTMVVAVEVCKAIRLTVSEKNSEAMRTREIVHGGNGELDITAAGQTNIQPHTSCYLGGIATERAELNGRSQALHPPRLALASGEKATSSTTDRLDWSIKLNFRMHTTEVLETLSWGCVT